MKYIEIDFKELAGFIDRLERKTTNLSPAVNLPGIRLKNTNRVLDAYKAYAAKNHYRNFAGKPENTKFPASPFLSLTGKD